MTTYIITFEINDAAKKNALMLLLKSEPGFCPIHDNACAIRTDKILTELKAEIVKITTILDRVFIIKTGKEAIWINTYSEKNSEWLNKYL
jgi:hypothetical protein